MRRLFTHHHGTPHVRFDRKACAACGDCAEVCPRDVIEMGHHHAHFVDAKSCDGCLACARTCPHGALTVLPEGV